MALPINQMKNVKFVWHAVQIFKNRLHCLLPLLRMHHTQKHSTAYLSHYSNSCVWAFQYVAAATLPNCQYCCVQCYNEVFGRITYMYVWVLCGRQPESFQCTDSAVSRFNVNSFPFTIEPDQSERERAGTERASGMPNHKPLTSASPRLLTSSITWIITFRCVPLNRTVDILLSDSIQHSWTSSIFYWNFLCSAC